VTSFTQAAPSSSLGKMLDLTKPKNLTIFESHSWTLSAAKSVMLSSDFLIQKWVFFSFGNAKKQGRRRAPPMKSYRYI
jgi:hypothetical protein